MKKHILLGLAFAFSTSAFADPLKVGDPAPAMKVAKWVKGKPVDKFEPGKKYVVEFWATWCGPCRESIPHLTEMAKANKDVTFIGVSVYEKQRPNDDTDFGAKVSNFVKDMGTKMDYRVAQDDFDKNTMGVSWMEAAGRDTIPTAFLVIDQKIAWIGYPADLESVLSKVSKGTFDAKAEAAEQAKRDKIEAAARQAQEAEARKLQELLKPVADAAETGDFQKAVAEIDKIFVADPEQEKRFFELKLDFIAQYDEKEFFAYGRRLADGPFKDDAILLNQVSWKLLAEDAAYVLKYTEPETVVKIAERANDLSKKENALILDTLALAYFKAKKIDLAISTQEKAVAQLDKTPGVDEDSKKEIKDRLEKFKKAKKDGGG